MPMSIRFDEQRGQTLEAKRPSKLEPWEQWSHEEARWVSLGRGPKVELEPYMMPAINENGRDAAGYLQEILPDCDGWHVLIAYVWVTPTGADREVLLGLARSKVEFKQGRREAPDWSNLARQSIWERLMADDSDPPPPV